MKPSAPLSLATGVLYLCVAGLAAAAGGEVAPISLVRAEGPLQIDGRLDDPDWARAAVIDRLLQVEPIEGAPASEDTEIRLLYDSEFIYFGVRAWDREPGLLIASQLQRDGSVSGDDRISIALDTFHDRRNGYLFQVNPNGARRDGLIENSSELREEWDGIWYAEARIDSQGWTAEIAIPFKTLSFDPALETWGFNVLRAIRRKNELVRWTAIDQDLSFIDMAELGVIQGLRGHQQGLGLDVKPSLSIRSRIDSDRDRVTLNLEPGLDLFYKFTPSLTGILTFNTDFAETAADDRQINLTRFSLFFPEQRDFFLQDAGIFTFAELAGNAQPFHSRRIGIGPGGGVVGIRGGAKLTGRIGRLNLGLIDVRTAHAGALDAKNLAVGRLSLNVLGESSLGVIATAGDPSTNGENALLGADFNYRSSSFRGGSVLIGNVWIQQSSSSGASHEEAAYGARIEFPNDRVEASLAFKEIEENFNPALGFANRRGIREWQTGFRYRIRPQSYLRTADSGFSGSLVTDRGGRLQSGVATLRLIEFENQAGDGLDFAYTVTEERLAASFEISPGIVIPAGSHVFERVSARLETTDSRKLSADLTIGWGEFFTGSRLDGEIALEWRPSPHAFLGVEYEQNEVRLPEGSFTSRVLRARVNLNFTRDLSWTNFLQYDNSSDRLGLNSRLRWIVEPGNEIFLVFNPGFRTKHMHIDTSVVESIAKVGWTFRY